MHKYSDLVTQLLNKEQIEQRTALWYEKRQNMITASEGASALESNPYQTRYDLLKNKCRCISQQINNPAIEHGIKFEPIALEIYEMFNKVKVFNVGLLQHDTIDWLGASPDGISEHGKLVEIKCVKSRKISHHEPYTYWIQVQIQLEVANIEECDLFQCKFVELSSKRELNREKSTNKGEFIYNGSPVYWKLLDFNCKTIKRDKNWFKHSLSLLSQFYKDMILYKSIGLPSQKRNRMDSNYPVAKRTRFSKKKEFLLEDWSTWVSATNVRNYMLDDPILDWLNHFGAKKGFESDITPYNSCNFNEYVKNRGLEFECAVFLNLEKRFGTGVVKVANIYEGYSTDKASVTLLEMKKGTPIIVNGVLHNYTNNTFGIPDLIIRSDYINKICQEESIEYSKVNLSSLFSDDWHYVIIDIKFTTLGLYKNDNFIKKTTSIESYKAQVMIYNDALGVIQNYTPNYAFLLGRRIKQNSQTFDAFYKLGKVEQQFKDINTYEKTKKAVDWIKTLRLNGDSWNIRDTTITKLLPNMKNRSDYPWHSVKKEISICNKEITSLWYCGIPERTLAHKQQLTKWDDTRLSSEIFKFQNDKSKTLDSILKVNRDNLGILPNKLTEQQYQQNKNLLSRQKIEFYVDFETANGLHDSFESVTNFTQNYNLEILGRDANIIYMIGIGFTNPSNNKWKYKVFIVDRLTFNDERQIIEDWIQYIDDVCKKYNFKGWPKLYHWSNAEPSLLNKAIQYHNIQNNINWVDLLMIFKTIPITVEGALNFGLKNIAQAMFNANLIKTQWKDSSIDGLCAMLVAWHSESSCKEGQIQILSEYELMDEIIEYNEIDCKVMWDILKVIRKLI